MARKIYLLINSLEGVEPEVECIKEEIEKKNNEVQQGDLFINIKKAEKGYIDDIIKFAKVKSYGVINCGKTYIFNMAFQDTRYAKLVKM